MKAIMVMYDSLNRHMLEPYGCKKLKTPNFNRLAKKTVTFNSSYIGSMACMPARRELHTGRYNFLHRSWGPLEPFDDSMPDILTKNHIYSHLVSDHYHYWEEGGTNYHTKYTSWDAVRGQEGDPWMADVAQSSDNLRDAHDRDRINRSFIVDQEQFPIAKTFALGLEFLERNKDNDNWFLQLETFDPHEPYYIPEKYRKMFDLEGVETVDWPNYQVADNPRHTELFTRFYSALVAMCDDHLGKVLDFMDANDMWDDTMLIVNTDHGFLFGEHGWWGKSIMPFYQEVAHTPLFIWDPRLRVRNEYRESLVQTIDLPATILEYFDIERPESMRGMPLKVVIENDTPIRKACIFGRHGRHVNCTDGRYVYMRAPAEPENSPLFNYTLMPAHLRNAFSLDELRTTVMNQGFDFTKGCPVMRINTPGGRCLAYEFGTLLYDLKADPEQKTPLHDPALEERMQKLMLQLMRENDAPPEQYQRLGFKQPDWYINILLQKTFFTKLQGEKRKKKNFS